MSIYRLYGYFKKLREKPIVHIHGEDKPIFPLILASKTLGLFTSKYGICNKS